MGYNLMPSEYTTLYSRKTSRFLVMKTSGRNWNHSYLFKSDQAKDLSLSVKLWTSTASAYCLKNYKTKKLKHKFLLSEVLNDVTQWTMQSKQKKDLADWFLTILGHNSSTDESCIKQTAIDISIRNFNLLFKKPRRPWSRGQGWGSRD